MGSWSLLLKKGRVCLIAEPLDKKDHLVHCSVMFLSKSVEYAMRVMAYLALHAEEQALRAKDISGEVRVPSAYLSKILRKMVAGGLLHATKGHGGGFLLAREPSKIRLIDVFEAMEQDTAPRRCVFGLSVCSSAQPCVLHHRWDALNSHFQNWARTTSLQDIREDVSLVASADEAMRKRWKRKQP